MNVKQGKAKQDELNRELKAFIQDRIDKFTDETGLRIGRITASVWDSYEHGREGNGVSVWAEAKF